MKAFMVDDLLSELRHRKWTLYLFGPEDRRELYAATFQWTTCADVIILRNEDDATASIPIEIRRPVVIRPTGLVQRPTS